jgi:hypothetical protein
MTVNAGEEAVLLAALRRRGEQIVDVSTLSCSPEDYRAAARKIGRSQGWRIRTFLVGDGAAVAVIWVDREKTEIEEEATRRVLAAMFSDQPVKYDDALDAVRRENLHLVRDDE